MLGLSNGKGIDEGPEVKEGGVATGFMFRAVEGVSEFPGDEVGVEGCRFAKGFQGDMSIAVMS